MKANLHSKLSALGCGQQCKRHEGPVVLGQDGWVHVFGMGVVGPGSVVGAPGTHIGVALERRREDGGNPARDAGRGFVITVIVIESA